MLDNTNTDDYAQLKEELGKTKQQLEIMVELNKIAGKTLSLEVALQNVVDIAFKSLEDKTLAIRTYNEAENKLILRAYRGIPIDYEQRFKIVALENFLFNKMPKNGESIVINDISSLPPTNIRFYYDSIGIKSMISIPIVSRDKTVGLVVISSSKKCSFSEAEVAVHKTIVDQTAIIMENFFLHEGIKRLYIETIKALVKTIEAKDPYTMGHSERVAKYSLSIGKELGLKEEILERFEIAATLHDIGKIGIPENILAKPGVLTNTEFEVIKNHSTQGKQILEPIHFPPEVIEGVYHHHERFDGKGYPKGLCSKQIPLVARVLAVADSFDAMTSNRPYRTGLSIHCALNELLNHSGTQFDPEVIEAFLSSWNKMV